MIIRESIKVLLHSCIWCIYGILSKSINAPTIKDILLHVSVANYRDKFEDRFWLERRNLWIKSVQKLPTLTESLIHISWTHATISANASPMVFLLFFYNCTSKVTKKNNTYNKKLCLVGYCRYLYPLLFPYIFLFFYVKTKESREVFSKYGFVQNFFNIETKYKKHSYYITNCVVLFCVFLQIEW